MKISLKAKIWHEQGLFALAIIIIVIAASMRFTRTREPLAIVLSPHLDDAVLSLGGLIDKAGPGRSLVVTFMAGTPVSPLGTDWDGRSGFTDSTVAMKSRLAEDRLAASMIGASVRHYGYLDFQYRTDTDSKKEAALKDRIKRDIETLIDENHDKDVSIYGPAAFGPGGTPHPDHQLLHDAFMAVATEAGKPAARYFIYEDFPYVRQFMKENLGDPDAFLERSSGKGIALARTEIDLTADELSSKIAAISAYSSQAAAFRSFSGKDADIVMRAKEFFSTRCGGTPILSQACEVVYQID